MKKKQRRQQNKKQSLQYKGQEDEEILSQEEDTQDFSELEENHQYISIVEWKKLQEDSSKKMTGNNLIVSQRSQHSNDFSKQEKVPLKSCLKKIKKEIFVQYQELFGKLSEEQQLQTEISSEKLQLNQQQIKQCIIVTEFNNIMNDDDDEISINLDELDEFIYEYNDQKKNEKFDISKFDNIQKKIEFNQRIQFDHQEFHNNNQ